MPAKRPPRPSASLCDRLPRCQATAGLDLLTDADVRVSQHMAVGPAHLLEAGGHVALVRPSGDALKVYDMAGVCRSVCATWGAARSAVYGLVAEWEAGVDLSGA